MENDEISRFFFTFMTLMRNLRFDQGNPHCNWPMRTSTDLSPNAKLFQNPSTKGQLQLKQLEPGH